MANESHIKVLAQGVETWNHWRLNHNEVRPNLKGGFLRQMNLSGADLTRADLCEAHLEGSNLSSACLTKADLRGAHLGGVHAEGDKLTEITLSKADLATMELGGMNIAWTNLRQANLREADLAYADLSGADLRKAQISGAHLDEANLTWANLVGAYLVSTTLQKENLQEAYLSKAHLEGAHLEEANLEGVKLEGTYLCGANLSRANLCGASLVGADVSNAILSHSFVHGISAWNMQGIPKEQQNLKITRSFPPYNEPVLMVDNLEVAQFIYLLRHNEKISLIIDTMTTKIVLILGRFTPERKVILDAIRKELRTQDLIPVLFDFEKPESRDNHETITTLARLARFVIADITEAKSIPQELVSIVETLPSLPIQPLLQKGQEAWDMFRHIKRYPWVLPIHRYKDLDDLLTTLKKRVVDRAQAKAKKLQNARVE